MITACGEEPTFAPGPEDVVIAQVTDESELRAVGGPTANDVIAPNQGVPDAILGNSLPGTWRPFSDDSPWNTPIGAGAPTHSNSQQIIATMAASKSFIRPSREYTIPVWVVRSSRMEMVPVRSDRIFDFWDTDRDGWTDEGAPLAPAMWGEPTSDGHMCVIDPVRGLSWEMSKYQWTGDLPECTTYNVWDLSGPGHGDHNEGQRWQLRGGRGSGFPVIAGLVRPEEIQAGEIRHALTFTYSDVRMSEEGWDMFIAPPAFRGDGDIRGEQFPIEGMRLQLDPSFTEADFDSWGLTEEAKIIARALQTYGMYLGDRGGDMVFQVQLLDPRPARHRRQWESVAPNLFKSVEKIRTEWFRVVDTGGVVVVKD
jgi:hypothetical protein